MQVGIIRLQALAVALMEQAVTGIHFVILGCILLPDLLCLGGMESCSMFLKERLHVGHLQDTFIVIPDLCIPDGRTPFLNSHPDGIHVNDVVADLLHQLDQDHFVKAGEDLRIYKVADFQLHKPCRKLQLFSHSLCNLHQLFLIFTM